MSLLVLSELRKVINFYSPWNHKKDKTGISCNICLVVTRGFKFTNKGLHGIIPPD